MPACFLSPSQAGWHNTVLSDAPVTGLLHMRTVLRQLPFWIYCLTAFVTIVVTHGHRETPTRATPGASLVAFSTFALPCAAPRRHVPFVPQDRCQVCIREIRPVLPAGRTGPGGWPSPGDTQMSLTVGKLQFTYTLPGDGVRSRMADAHGACGRLRTVQRCSGGWGGLTMQRPQQSPA